MGVSMTRRCAIAYLQLAWHKGHSAKECAWQLFFYKGYGLRPAVVARYFRALDHQAGIKRPLFRR